MTKAAERKLAAAEREVAEQERLLKVAPRGRKAWRAFKLFEARTKALAAA